MRTIYWCSLFLLFSAAAAMAQVPPNILGCFAVASDAEERHQAGAALIETGSGAHLRDLFRRSGDADRPVIVLALARIGDRDDGEFFAAVLEDGTADPVSRRYAALGLGRLGGDRAVRSLERASSAASPELRRSIATALGNTRSRAAVPVLIGMFGNNAAQNEVCGALTTLTHRAWCDGTADDPAARRTRWMRWWRQTGSKTSIYGPDTCPPDSIAPPSAAPPACGRRKELIPCTDRQQAP